MMIRYFDPYGWLYLGMLFALSWVERLPRDSSFAHRGHTHVVLRAILGSVRW